MSQIDAILQALRDDPHLVPAANWPGDITGLAAPGLYSWWADETGARDLSEGLGHPVSAGLIYAGQTGATKWPSGAVPNSTLKGRIQGNHLRGRVRGSTFRLTLAAALFLSLGLDLLGPKKLSPASEASLGFWIRAHLSVAVHPFPDRDGLAAVEASVLAALDPPLNLLGVPPSHLRSRLSELRAMISSG